ncbi:MAG: ABC transporter substrate-binding protein [Sandaracinaceae bacterium]|nr:ABC transporter substrate-binding protein [Sandaracinaceae bacterium]
MLRIRLYALSWLLATLVPMASASAQDGARAYLERQHEEVNRILRQPAANDAARQRRSERLRTLLNGLLDYPELSRRALGEHWEARSEAERQQFVDLLRQLVERNYEGNLERILDFEVTYERESRRGDLTVVHTSARSRTQRRQPPVAIDYAMRRVDGTWRVVDVTTDGVSMVDNYRSQFHRIISRDGWDELIARMQRRLEQGAEAG